MQVKEREKQPPRLPDDRQSPLVHQRACRTHRSIACPTTYSANTVRTSHPNRLAAWGLPKPNSQSPRLRYCRCESRYTQIRSEPFGASTTTCLDQWHQPLRPRSNHYFDHPKSCVVLQHDRHRVPKPLGQSCCLPRHSWPRGGHVQETLVPVALAFLGPTDSTKQDDSQTHQNHSCSRLR